MSVAVIEDGEDGEDGMSGITHYKRRREELIGGALVNGVEDVQGVSGITPYKRYREERDGWVTDAGSGGEHSQGMGGITHYKTRRDERDGWTEREGFPPSSLISSMVRAEIDDGYKSAPTVNGLGGGLSDAIMTIEGLDYLFDFPAMPLEQMLMPTAAERSLMPNTGYAGLEAEAESPMAAERSQVLKLNDLLDSRRAVIATSDARVVEFMRKIKGLDAQIDDLAKTYEKVMKTDPAQATKIESRAETLDRQRLKALQMLTRYSKLRAVATALTRNVKAQIMLAELVKVAEARGDATSAGILKTAFTDIGKTTDKIHSIREDQKAAWRQRDQKAAVTGSQSLAGQTLVQAAARAAREAGVPAGQTLVQAAARAAREGPYALARYRLLNLNAEIKQIHGELRGWKEISKRRRLTIKETMKIVAIRARYDRLMAEARRIAEGRSASPGNGSGMGSVFGDIPAVWAVGDIEAELRELYGRIDTAKAMGKTEDQLQPLYQKAYNLRRMAGEQHAQGLSGWFSTVKGKVQSAGKAVAGAAKAVVKKVATTATSLGKFAACGVLARPGVAGAIGTVGGTIAAPGAGTVVGGAAGAATGAALAAACGTGRGGVAAAQEAGIPPSAVTQYEMGGPQGINKPIVGGFTLKHLLISAGVVAAGAGAVYFTRKRGAVGDIYETYGFRPGTKFADVYDDYGFKTTSGR